MGIRMLHRWTPAAGTPARADAASAPSVPSSPVPAFAADASTARIPTDLVAVARRTATRLRHRFTARVTRVGRAAGAPLRGRWTDLVRGYLALLLAAIPRTRPPRTITVFVASLTERPSGPGPHRPPRRNRQGRQDPGRGATP
ncbi:hypothetical protein [Streptomyces sp. NPDC006739]|uniref:hypothetical protein n=1 Tax=Streptomyces sp. NPDC006739 TaxID=3364763 RepID=UPI0036CED654